MPHDTIVPLVFELKRTVPAGLKCDVMLLWYLIEPRQDLFENMDFV